MPTVYNQADYEINPLAKYFRLPGVHIKLPTNGAFMPPGSIEFTMTGDIPVFLMRNADEMLLKSPDALMSGYAIEELIKSCIPAIKTPRLISNPDLDVILVAIRAATYGEVIDFSPTCPSCGIVNEVKRNLSHLLSTMTIIDPENPVRLTDEIIVYLRPYNINNATTLGVASFEESRRIQGMDAAMDDVLKTKQINASMKKITDLSTDMMADCILKVLVPNNEVVDPKQILEWVRNISKSWTDKIQSKLEEINKKGINKSYDVVCASCGHEWEPEIEFNPTTFFVASS